MRGPAERSAPETGMEPGVEAPSIPTMQEALEGSRAESVLREEWVLPWGSSETPG